MDEDLQEISLFSWGATQTYTQPTEPRSAPAYLMADPRSPPHSHPLLHSSVPERLSKSLRRQKEPASSSVSYESVSAASSNSLQNFKPDRSGPCEPAVERPVPNEPQESPARAQPIPITKQDSLGRASSESFVVPIFTRPRDEDFTPQTDDAASCCDHISPTQRHVNQFSFPPPDGDPSTRKQSAELALRTRYPPRVVDPATRASEVEFVPKTMNSKGLNVDLLLEQNENRVKALQEYAEKENAARMSIYGPVHVRSAQYEHIRERMIDLNRERGRCQPRISEQRYNEITAKYNRQLKPVVDDMKYMANDLWFRKLERDTLLAEVFDWKPFDKSITIQKPDPPYEPPEKPKPLPRDPFDESIPDPEPPPPVKRPEKSPNNPVGLTFNDTPFAYLTKREKPREKFVLFPSYCEGSTIPEWFKILEERQCVHLRSQEPGHRYNELLTQVAQLEENLEAERHYGGPQKAKDWDKYYHPASQHWEKPWQQKRGGWWKCRSGPGAPKAERYCRECHDSEKVSETENNQIPKGAVIVTIGQHEHLHQGSDWSNQAQYDWIMDQIRQCQHAIGCRDKELALQQLQAERQEAGIAMQHPNWKFWGGFLAPRRMGKKHPGGGKLRTGLVELEIKPNHKSQDGK